MLVKRCPNDCYLCHVSPSIFFMKQLGFCWMEFYEIL